MASNQLDPLRSHHSRLPTFLYPLSFSPPCPSPFRHPVAFLRHPFCLYTIGTISALSAGACLPASGIVYGWWTNGVTGSGTSEGRLDRSKEAGWIMTLIGVAAFFLSWAFLFCCKSSGLHWIRSRPRRLLTLSLFLAVSTASDILTTNLRRAYVSAVLIQDQNFYDTHGPGEIASRAGKDINTIRTACGEKIGFVMWSIGTLIAVSTAC
jgi:ATP-binding cassette subfamily B (MDR/TAP) protein 1